MCWRHMKMHLSPYISHLIIVTAATALYVMLICHSQRIGDQYVMRNVLSQVANYGKLPNVVDNTLDSLKGFYISLIDSIELQKLPYGYDLDRLRFVTNNGIVDLLQLKKDNISQVDLTGDAELVLRIYNRERETYGESTCYLVLNSSNVWEFHNDIITLVSIGEYDVLCFCGLFLLFSIVLLRERNRYTYALAASGAIYIIVEVSKRIIVTSQDEWIYVTKYLEVVSSVAVVAMSSLVYKIQAYMLSTYSMFNSVFLKVAEHLTFLLLSLLMLPFLHYLVFHILYFFVWVPIFSCIVLSTVGKMVKEEKDAERKKLRAQIVNQNVDGPSSVAEMGKVQVLDGASNIHSYSLITSMFMFTVILIIFCFKGSKPVQLMKDAYNDITAPFQNNISSYALTGIADAKGLSFQVQKRAIAIHMEVSSIRKLSSLKAWIRQALPIANVAKQLCIIKNPNGVTTKHHIINETSLDAIVSILAEIKVTIFLVFKSSSRDIICAMLRFGSGYGVIGEFEREEVFSIRSTPEYVSIVIGSLLLVVLVSHIVFSMKGANMFSLFKNFYDLTVNAQTLLILLCVMSLLQMSFVISRLVLNYQYVPEVANLFTEDEKEPEAILSVLTVAPVLRTVGDVSVFFNAIFAILYVLMILPRYYYSLTKNGEVVKRPITPKLDFICSILYQYAMLLSLWSLMGNLLFGTNYYHMKSFVTALRHNLILGFNKVVDSEPGRYVEHYNGITATFFYNIGLTAVLGVYYHYSWFKKQKGPDMEEFQKYKDNFKVNLVASVDDIINFKLFIKSVELHRKCMEREYNEVDHCKLFFERFTKEASIGISHFNGRAKLHMYLERIKKYVLCNIFIRMKIKRMSNDMQEMDALRELRNPINESKKGYLVMLKQKLHLTLEEIERFRRHTEILMAGKYKGPIQVAGGPNGDPDGPSHNASITSDISLPLETYDVAELLNFIMRPEGQTTGAQTDTFGADLLRGHKSPLYEPESLATGGLHEQKHEGATQKVTPLHDKGESSSQQENLHQNIYIGETEESLGLYHLTKSQDTEEVKKEHMSVKSSYLTPTITEEASKNYAGVLHTSQSGATEERKCRRGTANDSALSSLIVQHTASINGNIGTGEKRIVASSAGKTSKDGMLSPGTEVNIRPSIFESPPSKSCRIQGSMDTDEPHNVKQDLGSVEEEKRSKDAISPPCETATGASSKQAKEAVIPSNHNVLGRDGKVPIKCVFAMDSSEPPDVKPSASATSKEAKATHRPVLQRKVVSKSRIGIFNASVLPKGI